MSELQTRQRLLETAGTLFAQFGFGGVSTRQISTQAKVNIASIPYYFNSKEGLYREVVRVALEERNFLVPIARETVGQCLELGELDLKTVEERLREAAKCLYLVQGNEMVHGWPLHLLLMEMGNPSGLVPNVTSDFQAPMVDVLCRLFKALKPGSSDGDAYQWTIGLLAPMFYFLRAEETIAPFVGKGVTVDSVILHSADDVVDSLMNRLGGGLREV
jgi:TetR/AcrR family transcriptional regulator, regulator of cefoperazone and chloramphenicol sensitivity